MGVGGISADLVGDGVLDVWLGERDRTGVMAIGAEIFIVDARGGVVAPLVSGV